MWRAVWVVEKEASLSRCARVIPLCPLSSDLTYICGPGACGRVICFACSLFRPSIFGAIGEMRCCPTCVEAMER